jgi:Uma2 family endonuclease
MDSTQTLLTAEDLFALPGDGFRHELVNGELTTMTPAGSEHGIVAMRLATRVGPYVEARRLGEVFTAETGFKIASDPDTVRVPDLAFVRRERIPESGIPKGFWPGAPDLVAEVISPGDTYEEVEEKVAQWLGAGTSLVWVVNPRHRMIVVRSASDEVKILSEADELRGGDVLPGFRCAVAELFP